MNLTRANHNALQSITDSKNQVIPSAYAASAPTAPLGESRYYAGEAKIIHRGDAW